MNVLDALDSRYSCRAFRPDPVPERTVWEILVAAGRAPSGGNLQPWHVHALTGDPLAELLADVEVTMQEMPRGETPEYRIYPADLKEPYASRRFGAGEALYSALGVSREDKAGRGRQFRQNFRLFGAPVGLFVYLDRFDGPAAMGRLRHVPAVRDAGRSRARAAHLCPGSLGAMARVAGAPSAT